MKGITIKLPEATLRRLQQRAREAGRSVAALVREVLAEPPPSAVIPEPAPPPAARPSDRRARVQPPAAPVPSASVPALAPPAAAAEPPFVDIQATRRQLTENVTVTGATALRAAVFSTQWRPLPRTTAAAQTGMPLYGIEGIEPAETALSADGALVRTVYRLESGDVVELLQQRTAAGPPPAAAPPPTVTIVTIEQSLAAAGRGGGGRGGVLADRTRAATPRTLVSVRDDVRITLRTTSAADLDALGAKLRVD